MSVYLGNNLISGIVSPIEPTRNIGQIITSTIPLTDAGLHLLDGSLIQGGGVYDDFVTYISNLDLTANYFCTENEWQAAVTTYGVCGKFVYDSVNNTVRLPKYNSKIYTGGGNAPVVGNGIGLGLTDGTGNFGIQKSTPSNVSALIDLNTTYGTVVGTVHGSGSQSIQNATLGVTTDGTKSGIIADLANITTSLDGCYYIVIATSTKTAIEVDIDEIATDLNGKADIDLNNCTKPHIVEEYYSTGAYKTWYRIYSDGFVEQGGIYSGITTSAKLVNYVTPMNARILLCQVRTGATSFSAANYYSVVNFTSSTQGFYMASNGGDGSWYGAGYIVTS